MTLKKNPFKPGDMAVHKSNTLDARPVESVDGDNIILRIGTVLTPPLPHTNYRRIPKEA